MARVVTIRTTVIHGQMSAARQDITFHAYLPAYIHKPTIDPSHVLLEFLTSFHQPCHLCTAVLPESHKDVSLIALEAQATVAYICARHLNT